MIIKHLYILVDYFNVQQTYRQRGLEYTIRKIFDELWIVASLPFHRATLRLYGGWYEDGQLTRIAQDLLAEIESLPSTYDPPTSVSDFQGVVIFRAELAQSLLAAPSSKLLNTLRTRTAPQGVRISEKFLDCATNKDSCPLAGALHLHRKRKCPNQQCENKLSDLLYRTEQKMVDSMICADSAFLLKDDQTPLLIVSSDEDMAPIIKLGLSWPADVIHIDCARRLSNAREAYLEKSYTNLRI